MQSEGLRPISVQALLFASAAMFVAACGGAGAQGGEELSTSEVVTVGPGVDVTCGGRFPRAEVPFAQRPDGCSSWSNNPEQVRDSWGSADFRPTCNAHDRCYYTLGSDADACNHDFCAGLDRACAHAYCTKIAGVSVCEPTTHGACKAIAATYCAAVRAVAPSVHAEAQEKQREWEACVASPPAGQVETFLKHGNNGTASCDVYCAGPQWDGGRVGRANFGFRADTGERFAWDQAPGYLGGPELTCSCDDSRVFVKGGNNGTVTCNEYCAGSQWGEVGRCIAARREDNTNPISCDQNEYLNGLQQTCWCER